MSKPFALQHKARYRIVTACGRVYDCATFNRDDLQFIVCARSRRPFALDRVTHIAPLITRRCRYARTSFVPIAACALWPVSTTRRVNAVHTEARRRDPDLFVPAPWVHPIRARALSLPTEITR